MIFPLIETEFCVQEEDTDGEGNPIGWGGWSTHATEAEAAAALASMEPREGRLRVAKVVTETLLLMDAKDPPTGLSGPSTISVEF